MFMFFFFCGFFLSKVGVTTSNSCIFLIFYDIVLLRETIAGRAKDFKIGQKNSAI
jgi:hypothetical protein